MRSSNNKQEPETGQLFDDPAIITSDDDEDDTRERSAGERRKHQDDTRVKYNLKAGADSEGGLEPYPQDNERAAINAAFDRLFTVLRDENTRKKAMVRIARCLRISYNPVL